MLTSGNLGAYSYFHLISSYLISFHMSVGANGHSWRRVGKIISWRQNSWRKLKKKSLNLKIPVIFLGLIQKFENIVFLKFVVISYIFQFHPSHVKISTKCSSLFNHIFNMSCCSSTKMSSEGILSTLESRCASSFLTIECISSDKYVSPNIEVQQGARLTF